MSHRDFSSPGLVRINALTAGTLQGGAFAAIPATVVKPLRTKRTYLNHLLSKNAVGSNADYNKQLWARVRTGHYLPNPRALLRVVDDAGVEGWRSLEQVVNLPFVAWLGTAREAKFDEEYGLRR